MTDDRDQSLLHSLLRELQDLSSLLTGGHRGAPADDGQIPVLQDIITVGRLIPPPDPVPSPVPPPPRETPAPEGSGAEPVPEEPPGEDAAAQRASAAEAYEAYASLLQLEQQRRQAAERATRDAERRRALEQRIEANLTAVVADIRTLLFQRLLPPLTEVGAIAAAGAEAADDRVESEPAAASQPAAQSGAPAGHLPQSDDTATLGTGPVSAPETVVYNPSLSPPAPAPNPPASGKISPMDRYQPDQIEQALYARWERDGVFAPSGKGEPFCIAIPPPNVTGTLHMGHAFQHSLVDCLIRYKRMSGCNTLWQMGTDHAGISTQMIVEEQLALEQLKPSDIGRERFLERVWQWKHESAGTITRQLRRLGASLHWETERFTLDPGFCDAVIEAFVRLHEEDLIYRGKRLVNWDPQLETSLSDLEVVSEEEASHLWHFRYPLVAGPVDGRAFLVVATTRPETMLGDTAVAVHPSDERYAALVGRLVELPLTGRRIPVIADHHVDPAFGTGCVKITPAHDFNDYEVGRRHQLEPINIFTTRAQINEAAPAAYRGLDRFEARRRVVEDLQAQGLVERIEDYKTAIPRGERSGAVIEPYLSDQWFVRVKPLAEPAIAAVERGDIEFIPRAYENNYFAWMREIQDWCISRQQWWGHRIPAWYDETGHCYVARSEAEARRRHALPDSLPLRQDEDVLDTWFSSQLWTFGTLGWPASTPALATWHPTDVLATAHDIITFWVARMIMVSLKFRQEVPFHKVFIHGIVTDVHGDKMSKSKGNGLDPLDIIDGIELEALVAKRTNNLMQPRMAEQIARNTRREYPQGIAAYGTDALRFTFCSIATSSRTIRFDMQRVEGYRNFCNKLWNAAKFVLNNAGEAPEGAPPAPEGAVDRWIWSALQRRTGAIREALEDYRFDLAARNLYELVWDEFCDWYLELAKPLLQDPARAAATRATLLAVLRDILRLAHPFIPFITEEIWLHLPPLEGVPTLVTAAYPTADERLTDSAAEADVRWLMDVITGTRTIRGEINISFGKKIPVLLANGSPADHERLNAFRGLLEPMIRAESIGWLEPGQTPPPAAIHLVGELKVLVPMADLIDQGAELERLAKEIRRKEQDIERARAKLANKSFVDRAPPDVVENEQRKLAEAEAALAKLEEQRQRVTALAGSAR